MRPISFYSYISLPNFSCPSLFLSLSLSSFLSSLSLSLTSPLFLLSLSPFLLLFLLLSSLFSPQVNADMRVYIPLVENMPSGTAIRPGDVLTMHSGKVLSHILSRAHIISLSLSLSFLSLSLLLYLRLNFKLLLSLSPYSPSLLLSLSLLPIFPLSLYLTHTPIHSDG